MAAIITQASLAIPRPCFLTGFSGKLARAAAAIPATTATSSTTTLKVEAKKGEWLPGLASPGYLNGRNRYAFEDAEGPAKGVRCDDVEIEGEDA
ncbi:hypothetical protein KSP40_PGU008423 [Platanthera guangdongensis]|uniref:Uncharacterized protein n=1 Tax=Platanthera guangdongensis TaxID=2320717 RepID=A0ABR2LIF7_9ASPA